MSRIYEKSIETLKKLIADVIREKGISVYLFGSRAKGKASYNSDIDIGIIREDGGEVGKLITLLKEKIENSNIPYKVDVVDLSQVPEEFREKALKEGKLLWRS